MQPTKSYVPAGRLKKMAGDASIPESAGLRFILQPVSDNGKYDDSAAILKRWPSAKTEYKREYNANFGKLKLGTMHQISVQSDTTIINMVVQHGKEPISLEAFKTCLQQIYKEADYNKANLHMNKFDVENWDEFEKVIGDRLVNFGLNVTVYEK